MDPVVMVARRGDRGGGMGSCIGVHTVTVIVAFTQVRMTIARIVVPPGVPVVIGGECKDTNSE